jgi:hypothetical protein
MPRLSARHSSAPEELSRTIETLYRSESGRVLATLARLLEDLDVAEEAMHEDFAQPIARLRNTRRTLCWKKLQYRVNVPPFLEVT